MDWTLTQLRSKIRELTGQLSTSQLSNDDLDNKINDFYRNVFPDEIELPELKTFYSFNTVASDGEYDLPQTLIRIERPVTIDDGDGDAVAKLGLWKDANAFFTEYTEDDSADENQPIDMLVFGSSLFLRPIPDAVYTVKMAAVQRPDALSGDSDKVTNPKWGPAVAYGTAVHMFLDNKDSDGASELTPIYQFHLNSINRNNIQRLTNTRSVPGF